MREIIRLSVGITILVFLGAVSALIVSGYEITTQQEIPEGNKPDNTNEAKWWEEIRIAGKQAASAIARKDKAFREAFSKYSFKYQTSPPDDEREIFSNNELSKMNAAITTSREKYTVILRKSAEISFKVPIPDGRPYVLYGMMPRYTEKARQNKIQGVIIARAEFLSDGTIGKVEILNGLGYGLDEKADEAVRGIIFLPAREKGMFVTYWQKIDIEFNLR